MAPQPPFDPSQYPYPPQDFPDPQEYERQIRGAEQEASMARQDANAWKNAAESNFSPKLDANTIEYRLSSEQLLERIEHFLRGDVLKTRKDENDQIEIYYETPDNSQQRNLNDFGVSEIMRILSMYITKETFLSYYNLERINEIMADIGDSINDFMRVNFKHIGLDTEYKKTKYEIIILTILHSIESAYRRAINGNENRATREIIVRSGPASQFDYGYTQAPAMPQPKRKWWDKRTW